MLITREDLEQRLKLLMHLGTSFLLNASVECMLALHRLHVMREWFCSMTFIAGLQTANGNRLIDSQELSVHLFHKSVLGTLHSALEAGGCAGSRYPRETGKAVTYLSACSAITHPPTHHLSLPAGVLDGPLPLPALRPHSHPWCFFPGVKALPKRRH